jgi:hypothetical protein
MGGAASASIMTHSFSCESPIILPNQVTLLYEGSKEGCGCNEKFIIRIYLQVYGGNQAYEVSALHCQSGKESKRVRLNYEAVNRLYNQSISNDVAFNDICTYDGVFIFTIHQFKILYFIMST